MKTRARGGVWGVCLLLVLGTCLVPGCGGGRGGEPGTTSDPLPAVPDGAFTVVVLPDTQYYSLGYPNIFTAMTRWTADRRDERNIVFVLHEGDIVHRNTEDEWANAEASMRVLDGVVPYAICVGNHDYTGDRDTTRFNAHFPVSRYEGTTTFGGVFEPGKYDNSWHVFGAGGTDWLVMSLEYDPRDEALEWANQIVGEHPDHRVIVLTHAYLYYTDARTRVGEHIWNEFVRRHANISFVFNGHYTGGYAGRLVSDGDHGNRVYQMFANYQTMSFGGYGLLRLVEFDPDEKMVTVRTYSPWTGHSEHDDDNEFSFEDVELGPP